MNTAPYYFIPYLEELRALPADAAPEERQRLEQLIEVNVGDTDIIADLLGRSPVPFDDFYGDRNSATPDTADTISLFLSNFGTPAPATVFSEEVPIVPAIDYAAAILDTPAQPESNPPTPGAERSSETAPLTESLVKILVKNGKYDKALQIIRELNLKNPEKSIYFADQMRFLRKLIICRSKSNT